MSVLKGYPGKNRDTSLKSEDIHVTAEPIGKQVALTVNPKGAFLEELSTGNIAGAGSTSLSIELTAHNMQVGDVIRFDTNNKEVRVVVITDANNVRLGEALDFDPIGLAFSINRSLTPKVNSDGSLPFDPGPLQYNLDGAPVEVTEDTVTPANNRPLPVKLTGVTGDINITANDLHVQLEHSGANPDSVQIGDGTEVMAINASNEATVNDADANVKLADVNTELDSQTVLLGTIDADTGSIDTKLTTTNSTLSSIDGKDFATQTTLAALLTELQAKADLTETQPVSAASLPLPTGASTEATLASLEAKDFATQTTSAAILTELQLKADLTETQPVSAASLPLPTGAATEATLASLAAEDFASQTTLAALLTELQAKADLSETQPVSAASLPLPTGAATETTLASLAAEDFATQTTSAAILTELQLKADLSETQPVSAASLPLPTGAATEATLSNIEADTPSGDIMAGIKWSSVVKSTTATTDIYTYTNGGPTVAVVTVTYADSTKDDFVSAVRV